jgi:hypothetical protein
LATTIRDRDGDVDYNDFTLWFASYDSTVGGQRYNLRSDFNHDGIIDFVDFIIFVDAYGTSRGPNYVLFGGDEEARVVSWTANKIVCEVPFFAVSGNVRVVVNGTQSNGKSFSILSSTPAPTPTPTPTPTSTGTAT